MVVLDLVVLDLMVLDLMVLDLMVLDGVLLVAGLSFHSVMVGQSKQVVPVRSMLHCMMYWAQKFQYSVIIEE